MGGEGGAGIEGAGMEGAGRGWEGRGWEGLTDFWGRSFFEPKKNLPMIFKALETGPLFSKGNRRGGGGGKRLGGGRRIP